MEEFQQRRFSQTRSCSASYLDQLAEDDSTKEICGSQRGNPTSGRTIVKFSVDTAKVESDKKKEDTRKYEKHLWTIPASIFYALILVLIGIVAAVSEGVQETWLSSGFTAGFLAYLYSVSTLVLILAMVSLSFLHRKSKSAPDGKEENAEASNGQSALTMVSGQAGGKSSQSDVIFVSMQNCPSNTSPQRASSNSLYKLGEESEFSTERNSNSSAILRTDTRGSTSSGFGSESYEDEESYEERVIMLQRTASQSHEGAGFFLRLGCLMFGIGNFVYVALEIHASALLPSDCPDVYTYQLYIQLVFQITQTLFLFKYSTMCLTRFKPAYRLGLQHLVATNLVVWIQVLSKEVAEAKHEDSSHDNSAHGNVSEDNVLSAQVENCSYLETPTVSQFSPYLFPFILEYSLLAMSIMLGMYQSLNLRLQMDLFVSLKRAIKHGKRSEDHRTETFFKHAHHGLFIGALVLAITIFTIIITLIYHNIDMENAHYITHMAEKSLVVLVDSLQIIALIACAFCFRRLEVTFSRSNQIDQILLIISVAGTIALQLFILPACIASIVTPSTTGEEAVRKQSIGITMAGNITTIIFAIMQTIFILEGLQLHTTSAKHQQEKPGREAITFLVITNISMWLFGSLTDDHLADKYLSKHYRSAWPVISSLCIPLNLFFRFHSSVCLADIWGMAYMTDEGGLKYKVL